MFQLILQRFGMRRDQNLLIGAQGWNQISQCFTRPGFSLGQQHAFLLKGGADLLGQRDLLFTPGITGQAGGQRRICRKITAYLGTEIFHERPLSGYRQAHPCEFSLPSKAAQLSCLNAQRG